MKYLKSITAMNHFLSQKITKWIILTIILLYGGRKLSIQISTIDWFILIYYYIMLCTYIIILYSL